jgi:hypothetical protein
MGRWTQYEEDEYRLPEGVTRIAYDADSCCYTFRDRRGMLYQGPPGEAYGTLRPLPSTPHDSRPVFDTDAQRPKTSLDSVSSSQTFHDFLPADRITGAPPPSDEKRPALPHARSSKPAIRRHDPKPGMMRTLVRVMTFRKKPPRDDDKDRLLLQHAPTDWDVYENYSVGTAAQKTSRFTSSKKHHRL